MSVYCPGNETPGTYQISMDGTVSFHLDNRAEGAGVGYFLRPWYYIELTSIEAERINRDGVDLWKLAGELWDTVFEVVAESLQVEEVGVHTPELPRTGRDKQRGSMTRMGSWR